MRRIWVEGTRGSCIETRHEVVAVALHHGQATRFGETSWPFPARSVVKPLQALPMLRSAVGRSLRSEFIAIAVASHNGEAVHVETVTSWLGALGLGEDDLRCPATLPLVQELAEEYARAGNPRRRAVHNCSGKHTGFLALALARGDDPTAYLSPTSGVQREVFETLGAACGCEIGPGRVARDGCGAPVVCLTLDELARGISSLVVGGENATEGQRLIDAIRAHPYLLAGAFRFDTRMVALSGGRCLSKVGADGMHVALVPGDGVAIAVKSLDGSRRAAEIALSMLLRELVEIDEDLISEIARSEIYDDAGVPVGEFRARLTS